MRRQDWTWNIFLRVGGVLGVFRGKAKDRGKGGCVEGRFTYWLTEHLSREEVACENLKNLQTLNRVEKRNTKVRV